MARRGLWLGFLLCGVGFVACVSNHDALEKKPAGRGGNGSGGNAGNGGAPSPRAGSGGSAANGGGHSDDEPPGKSVLTIVNGIIDAPSVALCLAKVDPEGQVTPLGSPLTDAPLAYGQSLVLGEVEDIDFDTEGLEPIVIAGELQLISGLDCEAAIDRARAEEALSEQGGDWGEAGAAGDGNGATLSAAAGFGGSGGEAGGGVAEEGGSGGAPPGPSPVRSLLRVRGLPAIPAEAMNTGRSLVFVANGCLGGATYTGPEAAKYCGADYSPRQPTASAVLVSLSRQVADERVALQAVHASLAGEPVELRSRPPFPSKSSGVAIATVALGQAAPRPASIENALFDLGSARKFLVSIESQGEVLYEQPWTSVLAQGGLSELKNGRGYALIVNGPELDSKAVPNLWNGPTLTAVAVDPE